MSVHDRVYRSLLMLYPAEHRREYSEPMVQLVRDRMRDEGGGVRTGLVWIQIVVDLVRSALAERTETTMNNLKTGWWRLAAAMIGPIIAYLGIGDLMTPESGPLYGRIGAATAGVVGCIAIYAGLIIRRRKKMMGSYLIAAGTLPGTFLMVFFWFPPVALIGVLALAVVIAAAIDAPKHGADVAARSTM